jgi:hypothetical protein
VLVARSALAGVMLLVSAPAFADEKDTCADAHIQGQTSRRDGELLDAKERFLECADARCPELVKKDCTTWAAELASSIPSVVIDARDEDGREAVDVTLSIDGKPRGNRLDGRAIELDPGSHVIRIQLPNGKISEQQVMMHEGERVRRVTLRFPSRERPKPEKPPSRDPSRPSVLPFVFGGVAVVALGSFGTFALLGKQKQNELDECRPDCSQSDVDSMRTRYAIGDISLAVGAVATGLTLYFAFSSSGNQTQRAFVAPRVGSNAAGLHAGASF